MSTDIDRRAKYANHEIAYEEIVARLGKQIYVWPSEHVAALRDGEIARAEITVDSADVPAAERALGELNAALGPDYVARFSGENATGADGLPTSDVVISWHEED